MSDTLDFDEDEPKKQTGLVVAAGGLGLLLVVMNLWPDGKKQTDAESEPVIVSQSMAAPPDTPVVAGKRHVTWPELSFQDVVRTNPFRMNPHLAEVLDDVGDFKAGGSDSDAETQVVETLIAPQLDPGQYPVKFVFQSPAGNSAMIGDAIYHEGDSIDGLQVVRISQHGVTLGFPPNAQRTK